MVRRGSAREVVALALVVLLAPASVAGRTGVPKWLPQSWYFSWTPAGVALPAPITAQCETIQVTWERGAATGPDPIAPYYLQVYNSNYIFPFIIPTGPDPNADLTIPFPPGSQYEICMFDSNGNTGGCQAIYTVYSNSTSTPQCANWTMPTSTLSVKSESAQGALSMYGWVDSCSDIRVTPQGGTPPFTFTVAPALHPPLNITSNDMSPINWTVSLSWASPFFISLVDSTGLSWSNGPIHSGDGDTKCLAADASSNQARLGETVGATVAGVVLGALGCLLATFLISRHRANSTRKGQERVPTPFLPPGGDSYTYNSLASRSPPNESRLIALQQQFSAESKHLSLGAISPMMLPREYNPEPYRHDGAHRITSPNSVTSGDTTPGQFRNDVQGEHARTASTSGSVSAPDRQEGGSQVYVIHHDSGRAPVSVITSRGTEVVELPPGYSSNYLGVGAAANSGSGSQDVAATPAQRRQWNTSGSR
ncbi:hypothetical protein JB92DRAFT_3128440 [Gautieria morchelliformis]|nr:hypothetical protein JB92DRAFT_3128440 [Gautieria morchelliformis]